MSGKNKPVGVGHWVESVEMSLDDSGGGVYEDGHPDVLPSQQDGFTIRKRTATRCDIREDFGEIQQGDHLASEIGQADHAGRCQRDTGDVAGAEDLFDETEFHGQGVTVDAHGEDTDMIAIRRVRSGSHESTIIVPPCRRSFNHRIREGTPGPFPRGPRHRLA